MSVFASLPFHRLSGSPRRFWRNPRSVSASAAATAFVALLPFASAIPAANAATPQNVFLDFANFGTRLNELATTANVDAFTLAEQTQIQNNVMANLVSTYNGFAISFSQTAPAAGPFETIKFGNTTAMAGLRGDSQGVDYRNLNQSNTANVFTSNFAPDLAGFMGNNNRAQQITNLSISLQGTAAHELGHNLGLQHFDSYGDLGITPANYANTGGLQNNHIMIPRPNLAQRLTVRTFNTEEKAKLEYAQGLSTVPPPVTAEQAAAHNTLLTAQAVPFTPLPISGVHAFSLTGKLSADGEEDYYSFFGAMGNKFTADILSDVFRDNLATDNRKTNGVNTILTLFDAAGMQLFLSNEVAFAGNTIDLNSGIAATESGDPTVLHYILPATGTYYLRVSSGLNTATGSYELFAYGGNAAPEPSTLILAVTFGTSSGGFVLLHRRRRCTA